MRLMPRKSVEKLYEELNNMVDLIINRGRLTWQGLLP